MPRHPFPSRFHIPIFKNRPTKTPSKTGSYFTGSKTPALIKLFKLFKHFQAFQALSSLIKLFSAPLSKPPSISVTRATYGTPSF